MTPAPAGLPPALATIIARRSVGRLAPPGPTPSAMHHILAAAASAPDHEQLRPWAFVVLEDAAKEAFGTVLADAYRARCHAAGIEPTPGQLEKERTKLGRAPVVLVVAATPRPNPKIPEVEQVWSAAAAAQNALLAAAALGYGSMWRTGDAAYDDRVKEALGLTPTDVIVGFLYLGTVPPGRELPPHAPDVDAVARWWSPPSGAAGS